MRLNLLPLPMAQARGLPEVLMTSLLFQIHKQREMLWKAVEPSGSETFRREGEN